MYKTALRNQMRIHRTGSHSTMPAATGRVDLMPQWAQPPEEYYNTLREQFGLLVVYVSDLQEQIAPYTQALKRPLHPNEFENIRQVHDEYGYLIDILNKQIVALRPIVLAADMVSRDALSWHVAKGHGYINPDDVELVKNKVIDLIKEWRPTGKITKGRSGKSADQNHEENRKRKLQRRRQKSRDDREFWRSMHMEKSTRRNLYRDEIARDKEQHHRMSMVRSEHDRMAEVQKEQQLMADKLKRLKEHFSA
jgi:hypothetical protein